MKIGNILKLSGFLKLSFLLGPLFIAQLLSASIVIAENHLYKSKLIEVELLSNVKALQPNSENSAFTPKLGVLLVPADGWHVYWENSGDSGRPPSIKFTAPEGFEVGEVKWPKPIRFEEPAGLITYGYKKEVLLSSYISSSFESDQNERPRFKANVKWLVCSTGDSGQCIPGRTTLSLEIPYSVEQPLEPTLWAPEFEKAKTLFPKSLPIRDTKELFKASGILHLKGESIFYLELTDKLAGFENNFIRSNFQVFPKKHSAFELEPALLLAPPSGNKYLVSAVSHYSAEAPRSLRANIAVGDDLIKKTGLSSELGYFELSASAGEVSKTLHQELNLKSSRPVPLTYRTIQYGSPDAENKNLAPAAPSSNQAANISLLTGLLSAFAAGVILNLMPCVLPVLSIKIFSLIEIKNRSRKDNLLSLVSFTLGILFSFLILAIIIERFKATGETLGWGFQFQNFYFVYSLAVVMFLLALSFFDIFTLQAPGANTLQGSLNKIESPLLKQFFDGVLITVLSTPCTAPFLGTAIALVLTSSSLVTYLTFLLLGLGLAAPYVILALTPGALRIIPKPGNWMITFKQLLGFLLLASVLWLLYVLDGLRPGSAISVSSALLGLFFLIWLREAISPSFTNSFSRTMIHLGLVLLAAVCLYASTPLGSPQGSASAAHWEDFSEERIEQALASGQAVFVDFTARWCVTCKSNKLIALDATRVKEKFKAKKVLTLRADWTAEPPHISKALEKYVGQKSVPQYLLFTPGKAQPEVLPTLLSPGIVLQFLNRLG